MSHYRSSRNTHIDNLPIPIVMADMRLHFYTAIDSDVFFSHSLHLNVVDGTSDAHDGSGEFAV